MWTRWFRLRSNDDFAAEVESHIEMETERLVRSGMSEEDARHAARRAFGNPTASREQFRDARTGAWFASLMQDVRFGLRAMRRSPGFTGIAVASLAIGIGANTTMFGTIDTLLFRNPPFVADAERIHRVYFQVPFAGNPGRPSPYHSYKTFAAFRANATSVDGLAAIWQRTVSSGRGEAARSLDAVAVSANLLPMLGVRPLVGRFFSPDEERDDAEHVTVISYEMWSAQFARETSVLGKTLDVAGLPYTIIGVTPEGFTGVDFNRVDLWLPLGIGARLLDANAVNPAGSGSWLEILAKRASGVTAQDVEGAFTQIYRDAYRGARRYEESYGKARAILGSAVAARGPGENADAGVSRWIAVVSVLVLLIASANVANLLLLRGLTRSREVALRLSLGASRGRIMRQWLVEGALLATAGAICAIVLARSTASLVHTFLLPNAPLASVLDPRFLAFTAIIAIGTGVLASLIPALVTARGTFAPLLGTGRTLRGPRQLSLQRVLIGGQIALATVLLIGAGLFVTSLRNVRGIDLGVDAEHIVYVKLDLGSHRKLARDSMARIANDARYQHALETVRRLPGVAFATATAGEPLTASLAIALVRRGLEPVEGMPVPFMRSVGTDYFETMGTGLVRGRLFTSADHSRHSRVAIIDEATAKQYFPEGNGLDACVYFGDRRDCTEIIGVVKNTMLWSIIEERRPLVYLPYQSWPDALTMMEVRINGDPSTMIPAIRQAVLSTSPELPWVDVRLLSDRLSPQLRSWRLGASMFTAFGLLALGLAAVGLYGLLSYMVTQRSHEISVRKALGARNGVVVREVMRGGLVMTLAGVAIGVVGAFAAGRLISTQLYGVSPRDPLVTLMSVVVLVVVAVLACFAPARRATKVDPIIALRAE